MTEKKGEFVPSQKYTGMQVIDSKGSSVGAVKDVGVNVVERKINLIVTTRAGSDIQIPWDDIQSAGHPSLPPRGSAPSAVPNSSRRPLPSYQA